MSWIMRRLFNTRNIGYLVKKAQPIIQEQMDTYILESLHRVLEDEEFHSRLLQVTDSYYERYKAKTLGFIGGTQKGINAEANRQQEAILPNIFDGEGKISAMKSIQFLLGGGLKRLQQGGIGGQNKAQNGKGSQNAPQM